MRLFITLLALFVTVSISAQTYSEFQNRKICVGSNGFGEALPAGYATETIKRYPLLVFIHGLGEQGNGTTDLFNVFKHGPLAQVKWNNYNTPFVMIAPQFLKGYWPASGNVEDVVKYALQNYRIDTNKIYITGLSMGGAATVDYAQTYPSKIAAALPTCPAVGVNATGAKAIADANLPMLFTHNNADPQVSYANSTSWVNTINSFNPLTKAVLTTYTSGTHDSWTVTYDPTRKQFSGLNAYEWMLQYSRGGFAPPVVIPPVDPEPPQSILIIPTDERFVKVSKGWAQTSKDIYGSDKLITGTTFQAFYNAERWGLFSYLIPVPVGTYTIRLHFTELFWNQPGQRIFNVTIEGMPVLTNFDILSTVPKFAALQRDFQTTVNDGILNINFTAVKDNAKITGIEIIPGEIRTIRKITELQDSANNKILSRDTTYQR
jgi:predicted esterase